MISDVLSDSVSMIEDYQRKLPSWYSDIEEEINEVKEAMNNLRQWLDTPPDSKNSSRPPRIICSNCKQTKIKP